MQAKFQVSLGKDLVKGEDRLNANFVLKTIHDEDFRFAKCE